jgi:hypothetical protein
LRKIYSRSNLAVELIRKTYLSPVRYVNNGRDKESSNQRKQARFKPECLTSPSSIPQAKVKKGKTIPVTGLEDP